MQILLSELCERGRERSFPLYFAHFSPGLQWQEMLLILSYFISLVIFLPIPHHPHKGRKFECVVSHAFTQGIRTRSRLSIIYPLWFTATNCLTNHSGYLAKQAWRLWSRQSGREEKEPARTPQAWTNTQEARSWKNREWLETQLLVEVCELRKGLSLLLKEA